MTPRKAEKTDARRVTDVQIVVYAWGAQLETWRKSWVMA
jgi:hypothetical protein